MIYHGIMYTTFFWKGRMDMSTELPKIDTSNLWDKTYNILKERIIRRDFAPNEKLSVPDLAEQFGVSRTPVRDALNRLEMDGLVKTVSKVGTFVCAIEAADVEEIMEMRLMMEFWVIDKLPKLPQTGIEFALRNMEEITRKSVSLVDSSIESYLEEDYNLSFHIEFMKLGQNKKSIATYHKLMNYRFLAFKSSLVTKEMVVVAQNQHRQIIEAIRSGRVAEMRAVIKAHLDDSKERLLDKIRSNGGII